VEQRIVGVTGGMHTGNDPTFDLTLLQKQLAEIRQDLERVTKWVVGNGDPTEGLLWVVADLGKLMTANTEANATLAVMLDRHIAAEKNWGERLVFSIASQVATVTATVILGLLALGFITAVQRGTM